MQPAAGRRAPAPVVVTVVATVVALALASTVTAARAQPTPPPATSVRAAELFDLGRERLAAGDLAAACDAFSASQALEPAVGTGLNLADCLRRRGRLEDALAAARDAAHQAEMSDDPRRDAARDLIAALEADAREKPAEPPAAAATGERAVDDHPPAASHQRAGGALPEPDEPPPARGRRVSWTVVGLAAGATIIAGGAVALRVDAGSRQRRADALCPDPTACPGTAGQAAELSASAARRSRLAVIGAAGAGALATAAVLVWWRGHRSAPVIELGPREVAVAWGGRF
jgi:hypothetical protein